MAYVLVAPGYVFRVPEEKDRLLRGHWERAGREGELNSFSGTTLQLTNVFPIVELLTPFFSDSDH